MRRATPAIEINRRALVYQLADEPERDGRGRGDAACKSVLNDDSY